MGTKERAMKLLGEGVDQTVVASALGVTDGYISQLLTDESFAREVLNLRFQNLEGATDRDNRYNSLEDKFLEKLEDNMMYMVKPREILSAIAVLNKAVRRGVKHDSQPTSVKTDVVSLVLPSVIHQHFITNSFNQVVAVGSGEKKQVPALQDLTTISAKSLLQKIGQMKEVKAVQTVEVNPNGPTDRERTPERVGS